MSYQVLARKWRPQTFAEVVGQEHIGRTLRNAIVQNRIGHAYLFVGSRGIGKTTSARIFAKALNCHQHIDGEPCCKCESCLEVAQGNSLDVIEIDGASHNKVEDIREIRDNVQYSPAKGKYKIYIIDEVHMLTTGAWNALLKTLEEPPAHVKFLFATTEPHKVLPTIISRCQRFDLRRIPVPLIVQRLAQIAAGEGIKIQDQALAAIARAADGGMRDAQSIFDQMIAFCGGLQQDGGSISEQDVIDVFGLASGTELRELALALLGNDLNRAMRVLQALADCGRDLERLFEDLVGFVRNLMIAAFCSEAADFLEVSSSELADLTALGKSVEPQLLQRILQGLVAQEWNFRTALNKRTYLEVVLSRVMLEAHSVQIDDLMTHVNALSGLLPPGEIPPPRPPIVLPPMADSVRDLLQAKRPATTPAAPAPATPAPQAPAAETTATPAAPPAPAPAPPPPADSSLGDHPVAEELPVSEELPLPGQPPAYAESESPDTGEAAPAPVYAPEFSPEQWRAALCAALLKQSSEHRELVEILDKFTAVSCDNHVLVLAYDQRKCSEHEVRTVLDPRTLALLKETYQRLDPLGNLLIQRWTAAGEEEEHKNGLRAVSLDELDQLALDPFVQLFIQQLGSSVIDARIKED